MPLYVPVRDYITCLTVTHTQTWEFWMKLHYNQKEWLNQCSPWEVYEEGGRVCEGVKEGSMKFKLMLGRWDWRLQYKTKERVGAGMGRRIEERQANWFVWGMGQARRDEKGWVMGGRVKKIWKWRWWNKLAMGCIQKGGWILARLKKQL